MTTSALNHIDSDSLTAWIIDKLAHLLGVDKGAVDRELQFSDMGIDSIMAVSLVGELETHFGTDLDPTLLYTHPTIVDLVSYLCEGKK
jgi:acyl carrier protein